MGAREQGLLVSRFRLLIESLFAQPYFPFCCMSRSNRFPLRRSAKLPAGKVPMVCRSRATHWQDEQTPVFGIGTHAANGGSWSAQPSLLVALPSAFALASRYPVPPVWVSFGHHVLTCMPHVGAQHARRHPFGHGPANR